MGPLVNRYSYGFMQDIFYQPHDGNKSI